jgi:tetratricopeptide (TPR) repeat protein
LFFGEYRNFAEALNCYTEAITRNPKSQTLYSNRSAALLSLDQLPSALDDAKRAIELDSKWAKGYRRKASVLDAMKRYRESLIVYEKALEIIEVDKTLTSQSKTQEETEIKKILIGKSLGVYSSRVHLTLQ